MRLEYKAAVKNGFQRFNLKDCGIDFMATTLSLPQIAIGILVKWIYDNMAYPYQYRFIKTDLT